MTDALPLIYNPASGGGRGAVRFREAEALLAVKGIAVRPIPTKRPGHAIVLARELAEEGHARIACMGGDGTLSETANGILPLPAAKRPVLAALPSGTGNDCLRDFGVLTVRDGIERLATGKPRPMDAFKVEWPGGARYGLNIFGTALAARAGDRCNRQFKWLGHRGYDVAAMVEIARMKETPTRLTLDGKDFLGDFPIVMVCNSKHTGGAMKMAPDAEPDDGLLDVLTLEGAGRMEVLDLLATKLRKGTHVQSPKVKIRRAKVVRIEPREDSPLLCDGEVYGSTPVTVSILPAALRLLA
jgi:diacylglycerol kinase (ATP)